MSFPTNSLPIEFQQEHGTVDLVDDDDTKPDLAGGRDDGVEDEDLELDGAARGVWLCKVRISVAAGWRRSRGVRQNERRRETRGGLTASGETAMNACLGYER